MSKRKWSGSPVVGTTYSHAFDWGSNLTNYNYQYWLSLCKKIENKNGLNQCSNCVNTFGVWLMFLVVVLHHVEVMRLTIPWTKGDPLRYKLWASLSPPFFLLPFATVTHLWMWSGFSIVTPKLIVPPVKYSIGTCVYGIEDTHHSLQGTTLQI